ncbi:MAG TPA: YggS family pyridoxal phosphate-dependent enzyme [Candidatus Eremiobacteraeota bacterium]|nr:YggS family pyridoxal phosphate-dependent enzyme [Candidatus Eremiobacteraeota bacterium]
MKKSSFIRDNIEVIRKDIEKYKTVSGDILLLAVSKNVSSEKIREAYEAGIRDFGENYLQEAIVKMETLKDLDIRWHFIGHLQSNKAGKVAENFYLIQSVDTFKLARIMNEKGVIMGKNLKILLQFNLSGKDTKFGFNLNNLSEIKEISKFENIKLEGLMAMAPYFENPEESRPYFRKMKDLSLELKNIYNLEINYLSMGMTGDYKVALSEGANLVRIGSGIFGARTY